MKKVSFQLVDKNFYDLFEAEIKSGIVLNVFSEKLIDLELKEMIYLLTGFFITKAENSFLNLDKEKTLSVELNEKDLRALIENVKHKILNYYKLINTNSKQKNISKLFSKKTILENDFLSKKIDEQKGLSYIENLENIFLILLLILKHTDFKSRKLFLNFFVGEN